MGPVETHHIAARPGFALSRFLKGGTRQPTVLISIPQAADALHISPRTADRLWAYARAGLHQELVGTDGSPDSAAQ